MGNKVSPQHKEEPADGEKKFKRFFEQSTDLIFISDLNGNFTDVNESACRHFGYSREELLKMGTLDIIEKESLKENPTRFDLLHRGEHLIIERRVVRKDGSIMELEVNVKKTDDNQLFTIARDISERKKTEQLIQQSESNLRSIFENTNISYVLADKDLNIITMNSIAKEHTKLYFGKAFEEGRNMLEFIPETRREPGKSVLEKVFSGDTVEYESDYKLPDGSVRWFIIKNYPIRNRNREITGVCISGEDISKKKETETALMEAEVKFRNLVEQSLVGVYIIQDGKFAYVNPVFAEILGYTQEEIIGKISTDDVIVPEDRQMVREKINIRLSGQLESTHYELRGKKKNGEIIYGEVYGTRTTYLGKVAIIGTLLDITERKLTEEYLKKNERKYRLLFYGNPQPMWMISYPELRIIDVNEAAIQQYGYSREEFIGMEALELRAEEDRKAFVNYASKEREGINRAGIWRHRKKNGEIIHVEIVTHNILFEGRKIRLVHGNDVTDKLKAEEELKQMNVQLRRFSSYLQDAREDERKYIAGEIHDELGQLLTGIKMDLSWLNKRISPEQENLAERLTKTIELTDRTIESIRKIATQLRPGILDDLGLEEAIRWQINEIQKKSDIVFSVEGNLKGGNFSSEVSIAVFRILQESLTNVVRHAQAKKVSVKMHCGKEHLSVEVTDDGVGMDYKEAIRKKSIGIMGMQERATAIGGSIDIHSSEGTGTILKVLIPLHHKKTQNG